ncbi:MAG: T9SS type A sorting domain-containing protein [Flavobacteriales bacterium]|jgi:hypothetical protein|nr:T9SS type A sorting domain-containing protein [Flavobacteriales bacterium]
MRNIKYKYYFIYILLFPFFAFSQSYDWEKVSLLASPQTEANYWDSDSDDDGNIYVVNNFFRQGNLLTQKYGGYFRNNIYLKKYDAEFNLIWEKEIAHSLEYKDTEVFLTTLKVQNGRVYLKIQSKDSIVIQGVLHSVICDYDEYCNKSFEIEFDLEGFSNEILRAKGPANYDVVSNHSDSTSLLSVRVKTPLSSFNQPEDSSFVVFKGDTLWTPKAINYLMKYNSLNDSLLWRYSTSWINEIVMDKDGNSYLYEVESAWGWQNLRKVDKNGNTLWIQKIRAEDHPVQLQNLVNYTASHISKSGDIVSTYRFRNPNGSGIPGGNGYRVILFDGFNYRTLTGIGDENYIIVVYKSDGSFKWAKMSQSEGYEGLSAIESDENGNTFFAGYHYHEILEDEDTIVNIDYENGSEILLISYDSLGNYLWHKSEGGTGFDKASNLFRHSDGAMILVGGVRSNPCIFGNIETEHSGGTKTVFAKLKKIPLSVPILENNINLSIYPNPTEGLLYLSFMEEDSYDVSVFNSLGEELIQKRVQGNDSQLDLSTLSTGSYFVVVKNTQNIRASQQVIITYN